MTGHDPVADQSPDRLVGLTAELADPHPARDANSYPFAYDHIAQLFDHPAAPDLCVLHTGAHNWEDQGGHRGEHGSLGIVQARAPFVVAGKGVRNDGLVPRVGRLVDVAPTIAELLGCERDARGHHLAGQDGVVRTDVLDPAAGRPAHVVGFLFDGVNPNVLYAMAAAGEAPNVARLIEMGTAYEWGAMAGLPTVTLANHTSILTGRLPGHHGILHNAWFDRARGEQVITNSQATWPWAMEHLTPGVESLHDAVHRARPGAFTASVNEPCDLGADYSTFDWFRRGEVPPIPESPEGLPHTTERFVRPSKDYSWSSVVDHMGAEQAVGIWAGHYRDLSFPHADVHVVQLHPHRLRVPRGRPVLGDRGGVGARLRRARRRRAGGGGAGRRVRRHRLRARRRPRHAGDRSRGARRLGRRAARRRDRVPRRGLLLPLSRLSPSAS